MANQDQEIEVANTSSNTGFSMQKLVIVIVLVQLVMFGGFFVLLNMTGYGQGGMGNHEAGQEDTSSSEKSQPIYIPFDKFTVNFGGREASHFMQVEIQAMTHDSSIPDVISKNMPLIRNKIILILSSQTLESVTSPGGKENLQEQILVALQEILQKRVHKTGVEEVYFTNFVMQ